ncbi:MAG TPA: AAA family ATPase, partial [Bryobacteraceae bacterium]|nr:AAA family ATPase [Bryobacteraceae bacterium]
MITKFSAKHFKSIKSAELDLGRVNVFVGANGSGKSNLLEALGVLAAAAFGKIDDESLVRRGCRPGGYFRPLFQDCDFEANTEISAESRDAAYSVVLSGPEAGKPGNWEFRRELLTERGVPLIDRGGASGFKGDATAGLAALKLAELEAERPAATFLRALSAYSIYLPNTSVLRGLAVDTQNREPVGLSGGQLGRAINELQNEPDTAHKVAEEFSIAV